MIKDRTQSQKVVSITSSLNKVIRKGWFVLPGPQQSRKLILPGSGVQNGFCFQVSCPEDSSAHLQET